MTALLLAAQITAAWAPMPAAEAAAVLIRLQAQRPPAPVPGPGPLFVVIGSTPGALSWLPFSPPTPNVRLDGTPLTSPPAVYGGWPAWNWPSLRIEHGPNRPVNRGPKP